MKKMIGFALCLFAFGALFAVGISVIGFWKTIATWILALLIAGILYVPISLIMDD